MHIRTFTEQDSPAVVELWTRCGLVVPWNDPIKDIQRKLAVAPELFLIGELAGRNPGDTRLIATVMGGYEGHRGWINYLAVDPELQKNGYGRTLMAAVESLLIERGCPKINLMVRGGNEPVAEFYEALGFSRENVIALGKRLIPDN